ncbi:sensor histidine kinase [Aurantiacibacter marinus]|uniref:Sensor protein FixL n=1 Tax=Aurantiacibacter marinus TaxID=874156 RepID=A0A0H0XLP3_9SPHN|nr:PAS domain-containing sensor histidine kinase [Aurantiacibacter marinus]KLI62911.1 nitrogen fixation protein FixL [Aurantiacibacter marinus]
MARSSDAGLLAPLGGGDTLHALIDTMPDAMIVIDVDAKIVFFSHGAERMFGYLEKEIIGENVSMLMPSPDREHHDGYIAHYLKTGEKRIIGIGRVTTARARDGATFPVDLSIGEFVAEGETLFAGFIKDLTDSRETEQQLHALQAELAHVSRISTMGTLATSIAHELNQPLTAITNYANAATDLLEDPTGENLEKLHMAVAETAKEAIRAGQVVQRLRNFIAKGDGHHQLASLPRLVSDATALALVNGDGKGVDIEIKLDHDDQIVLVDAIQIQQVLVNLIRNALEAMQGSTIKRLQITSSLHSERSIMIIIADSGPGLDKHVAERLFHPFVSTKETGMGLGLSICHTIVTAHGGKIWAGASDLGGTQFHFTLPLAEKSEADG